MDAMTFWKTYGSKEAERVAVSAGTNYAYWKHMANGRRRPSVDLANELVKASDFRLDLVSLLPPKERKK